MEQVKQTAINWFEYQLKDNLGNIVINQNWQLLEDLIQQAKEIEKAELEKLKDFDTWKEWKNTVE
jgi:hypothetical protein